MDNTEGLYWVTFEIGSMGYLRRNGSEQVEGMVAQGRDGKCSWWVAATSHGGKQESSRRPQGFFSVARKGKIDDVGRWQQGFFSVFVVAKGWGLGVAGLFTLMVVIWLEGGGIGDSLWVCEFGRFYVWFEIWVTVVWCGGVLMGEK